MLTRTVILWSAAAVLLFWGVGAYNRLMRLRTEANTAFAAVEVELVRQIELVHHQLPQEGDNPIWAALQAAASQLATNLTTARHKPLDTHRIAALGAAQDALANAWQGAQRDAHGFAELRLSEAVLSRRTQLVIQTHAATEQFNQAVTRYNEAIGQFPALLLAFVFGFKPARALSQVVIPSLS